MVKLSNLAGHYSWTQKASFVPYAISVPGALAAGGAAAYYGHNGESANARRAGLLAGLLGGDALLQASTPNRLVRSSEKEYQAAKALQRATKRGANPLELKLLEARSTAASNAHTRALDKSGTRLLHGRKSILRGLGPSALGIAALLYGGRGVLDDIQARSD